MLIQIVERELFSFIFIIEINTYLESVEWNNKIRNSLSV